MQPSDTSITDTIFVSLPSSGAPDWIIFFEVISHLAAVGVFVVGWIALTQIKLARTAADSANKSLKLTAESLLVAKQDIQVRSEREAVTLAASLCERFAEKVPVLNDHFQSIYSKGINRISWDLGSEKLKQMNLDGMENAQEWIMDLKNKNAENNAFYIANFLEGYAIYFNKGAASEEVAYQATGAVFCDFVNRLIPFIIDCRDENPTVGRVSGPFENTIEMFTLWQDRQKSIHLESQIQVMQEQANSLDAAPRKPLGSGRSTNG